MPKAYLGDGVYANSGSYFGEIVLTTENGIEATNRIVLDKNVVWFFLRWIESEFKVKITVEKRES